MFQRLFGTSASILTLLVMLVRLGSAAAPCSEPDNGTGTADLPPAGCGYVMPYSVMQIINGLPAGTTINIATKLSGFVNVVRTSGGPLGGEVQQFGCTATLQMNGTGSLAGFTKNVNMQCQVKTDSAPRTLGAALQSFATDMAALQGQLPPGDPDFDLLRVTAGTDLGMPSPGHTTLTEVAGLPITWDVYSYFNINYRIDFIGHSPGLLAGMSGTTFGTKWFETGTSTVGVPGDLPHPVLRLVSRPNPLVTGTTMEYDLPSAAHVYLSVHDAAGHLVRILTDEHLAEGPHAMLWNGRDRSGLRLPGGIYFVRFAVDGKVLATSKVVLLK